MDPRSFDRLARSLVAPRSRRGFLAGLAAVLAGVRAAGRADAQVTQVYCGNQACASNPGGCKPGCVCCVYTNPITGKVTNSRCRPPGSCSPGTQVGGCTVGANGATCVAHGDCCSGICQAGTCVATNAGTCAPGNDACATGDVDNNLCGNRSCVCLQTVAGATVCADIDGLFCGDCASCLPGQVCIRATSDFCCGTINSTMCMSLCPPEGGSALSCFTGETLVAMADGTTKPIDLVEIGDRVLGQTGVNRVEFIERPRLGSRQLYSLNGGAFFVTAEHPFLTEEGWKAIDPAATAAENPNLVVARLNVGDRLLALAGVAVPALAGSGDRVVEPHFASVDLGSLIGMPADPATPLYNLRLDGDHTYIANDLVVHNK